MSNNIIIIATFILLCGYASSFTASPRLGLFHPKITTTNQHRQQYEQERHLILLDCGNSENVEGELSIEKRGEEELSPIPPVATTVTVADSLHGRLLCASQCAYLENKELQGSPYFQGAGFLAGTSVKRLAPRSNLDACLVGRTVDGIVVAFRGTNAALQWLQNASVYLRRVPKSFVPKDAARVHEGFYGALKGKFGRGVKTALLELLKKEEQQQPRPKTNTIKIYVTGHSKGGSLASLFSLMLHNDEHLPSPHLACTFGAARVGNAAFGSYYENVVNQVTYENYLDIVPFLPPGESTMEDIETATEDPSAMMEMIESIMMSEKKKKRLFSQTSVRKSWKYKPIGKRTYIDSLGNLRHPVTRDLDVQRTREFEGTDFRDLRRAHCSSCSDDEYDEDAGETSSKNSSTCNGGYFAALAPEICNAMSTLRLSSTE